MNTHYFKGQYSGLGGSTTGLYNQWPWIEKNYLFAGNHDGAQRIAMMYSFFATCKANEVNPYEWLKATRDKMPDHLINRLNELLPSKIVI